MISKIDKIYDENRSHKARYGNIAKNRMTHDTIDHAHWGHSEQDQIENQILYQMEFQETVTDEYPRFSIQLLDLRISFT